MIISILSFFPEIQPGLHISEEVLELAEPDAGHGHELPHHREVAVARRHRLASVELDLVESIFLDFVIER